MSDAAFPEHPVARGLFLCDLVIQDGRSKKLTLVNIFERVRVDEFPSVPKPFAVYAWLTDGFGEVALRIEVESPDGTDIVYSQDAVARFTSRLGTLHFQFKVAHCSFPSAGMHSVVLYANGAPIAQARFEVVLLEGE